jgi:hypothetical protein
MGAALGAVVTAVVLLAAGCKSSTYSPPSVAAPEPAVSFGGQPPAVTGSTVTLTLSSVGILIRAADGDASGRTGHYVVFVDKDPPAPGTHIPTGYEADGIYHTTDKTLAVRGSQPGPHRFVLALADGTNARLGETQVEANVTVTPPGIRLAVSTSGTPSGAPSTAPSTSHSGAPSTAPPTSSAISPSTSPSPAPPSSAQPAPGQPAAGCSGPMVTVTPDGFELPGASGEPAVLDNQGVAKVPTTNSTLPEGTTPPTAPAGSSTTAPGSSTTTPPPPPSAITYFVDRLPTAAATTSADIGAVTAASYGLCLVGLAPGHHSVWAVTVDANGAPLTVPIEGRITFNT